MRLTNESPWTPWLVGVLSMSLTLAVAFGAFKYHRTALKAERTAEWFAVCSAIGWKSEVCKLSCQPARDLPALEVAP